MDQNEFSLSTDTNYMKRHIAGTVNITLPASSQQTTYTIVNHNLGYAPQYNLDANITGSGTYWYGGEVLEELTDAGILSGSAATLTFPTVRHWATNNAIMMRVTNNTSSSGGTRPVRYVIYLDYKQ